LSPDPAYSGWNQYAYPTNPNSFVDPLGLQLVFDNNGCAWDETSPNGIDVVDTFVSCGTGGTPNVASSGGTQSGGGGGRGAANGANNNMCIPKSSLNWLQKAQLLAAQTYADLLGLTVGFGVGVDGGAGIGSPTSSWNLGVGGSASTMIVADGSGNSGFLNSASGGFSVVKMSSPGSWWGAGIAAGPSLLVSPFSISKITGRSGSVSAGGGVGVLGGGFSLTTSGALTLTAGAGAGAEAGASPQVGTSQFIPVCRD
jgi:hypothetical protein